MLTLVPRQITATSVNGVAVANDGSITLPVDTAPTINSTNFVTSGGVKTELDALSARIGTPENPAQVWVDVSFTIPINSWSQNNNNNKYTATVQSSSILATSGVFVNYDNLDNVTTPIVAEESTGQVTFTTEKKPTGTITGTFRIVDSVNGIVPISRGGTGTNTFDSTPTNGSTNPVTSGGVYTALNDKVSKAGDTMTGPLDMVRVDNYPQIKMSRISNAATGPSTLISSKLDASDSQLRFCQRINDSSKWEYFRLPSTSTSLDANVMYDIITTKNPAEANSMKTLSSFSTIAELSTALNNELSVMPLDSVLHFRIQAAATVGLFVSTCVYNGELYKGGSNNYSHVMFYSNSELAPITGVKLTADWTFYRLTVDRTTTTTLVATLRDGGTSGTAVATGTATIKRAQNFIDFTLSITDCNSVAITNFASITFSSSLPSQIPAYFPIIIRRGGQAYFIVTAQNNASASLTIRGGDIGSQGNPSWTFESANTAIYAHEFVAI